MQLRYFMSNGDRYVFRGDMIIIIRVFSIFILPLLNKINVLVKKIPLVPTMTLLIKAFVNMED